MKSSVGIDYCRCKSQLMVPSTLMTGREVVVRKNSTFLPLFCMQWVWFFGFLLLLCQFFFSTVCFIIYCFFFLSLFFFLFLSPSLCLSSLFGIQFRWLFCSFYLYMLWGFFCTFYVFIYFFISILICLSGLSVFYLLVIIFFFSWS